MVVSQAMLRPVADWTPGSPLAGAYPSLWIEPDFNLLTMGGSRAFNGTDEYFTIADNAALSTGDVTCTIAVWAYLAATGADRHVVSKWGGSTNEFGLFWDDSEVAFAWNFGTGNVIAKNYLGVISRWYLIIAEHDATNNLLRIKVNDGPWNNKTYASGCTDGDSAFQIGAAAGASLWSGRIARCRFWKRTLTDAECVELYNSGMGLDYADFTTAHKVSLISSWPLNEASGNALDEHSTNHLTDTNTVTASDAVTTVARSYASASSEQHSIADTADLDLGTGDFMWSAWINRDTTGQQGILCKYVDVDNSYQLECDANNKLHFFAEVATVAKVDVQGTTAITSTGAWRHVAVAVDRSSGANTKIYLDGVNDTDGVPTVSTDDISNTGLFYIGSLTGAASYWNGKIARTVLAKPTDASAVGAAFVAKFWNGGDGCDSTALTAAEKADWGVVSMWDGDEASGALLDKVGARARSFVGATPEYFTINSNASLRCDDIDYSIAVKFYADSWNATYRVLLGKLIAGVGPYEFQLSHRTDVGGRLYFASYRGASSDVVNSDSYGDPPTGQWITVIGEHDATANTISIQVNDGAIDAAATLGAHTGTDSPLTISHSTTSLAFSGRISTCVLFKRKLTAAERTAFHNGGSQFTYAVALASGFSMANCSGWWDLNEYSAGIAAVTAIDYSGNANHLTDTNTVTSGPGPGTYPAYDMADNNTVTSGVGPGAALSPIADGDPIQQLISKDGNGYAFTQETLAKKPIWTGADADFNLRPTLTFGGTDDLLRYAGSLTTAALGTLVLVFMRDAEDADHCILSSSDEGLATHRLEFGIDGANNDHEYQQDEADVDDVLSSGTAIGIIVPQVNIWRSTGAASGVSLRVNGVADALVVDAGANAGDWFGDVTLRDNMILGALKTSGGESKQFQGNLASLILYDINLTDSQCQQMEQYVKRVFNIP